LRPKSTPSISDNIDTVYRDELGRSALVDTLGGLVARNRNTADRNIKDEGAIRHGESQTRNEPKIAKDFATNPVFI
jgi:hypothetical protein